MITRKNTLGCDIINSSTRRIVKSPNYNYYFNKKTGYFARWGATKKEDPVVAVGCEIADIEIVSGKCLGKCNFCYKCNNLEDEVKYMDLETFKKVFSVLPDYK